MWREAELLDGALLIRAPRSQDARGAFVKTHAASALAALGVTFDFREEFHSVSRRDVIRGMHLQLPPHDHDKIVYCPHGAALDVLLDLRPGPGHGRVASVRLTPDEPAVVFIPRGVAHGFRALAEGTIMVYKTSAEHAPSHDAGVRWDSFGFDWGAGTPVVSARDAALPPLRPQ